MLGATFFPAQCKLLGIEVAEGLAFYTQRRFRLGKTSAESPAGDPQRGLMNLLARAGGAGANPFVEIPRSVRIWRRRASASG